MHQRDSGYVEVPLKKGEDEGLLELGENDQLLAGYWSESKGLIRHLRNHLKYSPLPFIQAFPCRIVRTLLPFLRRFLYALVPQLIRTKYFKDPVPPAKIHATSWMNGIRGLAALAVFNLHFLYNFTYTVTVGYGHSAKDILIHQLPVFEFVHDGVCGFVIFFTVAGYACSYKPLQAITHRDATTFFNILPASVFRRWFRLYLPVFCSTFCICTFAYLGAYEPTRFLFNEADKAKIFPGPGTEAQPPRYPTLSKQLYYWWSSMSKMMNFWTEYPVDPPIDFHLWTIVIEYRASMHLYISLIALAACTPRARICLLFLLGYVYMASFGHFEFVSFFYGAIIAQLDILRSRRMDEKQAGLESWKLENYSTEALAKPISRQVKPNVAKSLRSSISTMSSALCAIPARFILYAVALFLMSFPMRGVKHPSPLYEKTVMPLIPYFYSKSVGPKFSKQVGVLLLMYLLTSVPPQQRTKSWWHRCLTSNVCEYLGRVMFGLYLVHGMVLHLFGYALPHFFWGRWCAENHGEVGIPRQNNGIFLAGLVVGWSISLTVALWAADVWTREVEGRCIKLTKRIEVWLFVK